MRLVRVMWSSASKSTPVQSCYSQLNQAWRTSKNGWANSNSKYQPFRIDSDAALHMNLNSIWVMWTMASFFPASHDRWFAAQFSPQTTRKKTLWHPGYCTSFLRCTMCKKKTHLSKYYKETCARNFSCSYSICTKHPHGKNLGDRVGQTCSENFACLWKYPARPLFLSTRENHQHNFGFRHLRENRMT